MEWFGRPCKGTGVWRGDFAVDDAFSAHLRGPLTGEIERGKLLSLL
jgi:hypothetical protein